MIEYMNRFEELKIRCRAPESQELALARFKLGLKPEIRNQMFPYKIYSIDDAFQLALQIEKSLQQRPFRKFNNQTSELAYRGPAVPNKFSKPTLNAEPKNKDVCFKCGLKRHMAWECPSKRNLYVDAI